LGDNIDHKAFATVMCRAFRTRGAWQNEIECGFEKAPHTKIFTRTCATVNDLTEGKWTHLFIDREWRNVR